MTTVNEFANRKVVILGLARQGLALARFFVEQNARVVISDRAPADRLGPEIEALAGLPVELALDGHPLSLLDDCSLLCLSGGVPAQIEIVQTALARNIPLSNDSLLTFQQARARGLGPIVAITGSSGKTTATTLVGEMLRVAGLSPHVGGNIGAPLIDRLEAIQPGEPLVLELSSFQLELFDPALSWGKFNGIGPDVGAILNITPNHLDRHADMADYAAAKLNMLRNLPDGATIALNADDAVTGRLLSASTAAPLPAAWALDDLLKHEREHLSADNVIRLGFSRSQALDRGGWLNDDRLLLDGEPICRRDEVRLRGEHNISNLLAAAVISRAAGTDLAAISQVARRFDGVPHRLEVVAARRDVTWINDSIATSPERAIAALRSFKVNGVTLILLAGGKDKNLPWQDFADEVIARVNMLIGFGDAGPMIVRTVQERAEKVRAKAPSCALVQRLDEAVELARRAAANSNLSRVESAAVNNGAIRKTSHDSGVIVLLSPGGTSYDAYRDFEARGEHFRRLVHESIANDPSGDAADAADVNAAESNTAY